MFAWSLIIEAIDGILYAGQRSMGHDIPPGMQTIKRIDGHAYFDLTALQWCWYDFAGTMPAQTVASIGGHQPEIPVPSDDPLTGPTGRRRKKTRLRILWRMLRFDRRARTHSVQFELSRNLPCLLPIAAAAGAWAAVKLIARRR